MLLKQEHFCERWSKWMFTLGLYVQWKKSHASLLVMVQDDGACFQWPFSFVLVFNWRSFYHLHDFFFKKVSINGIFVFLQTKHHDIVNQQKLCGKLWDAFLLKHSLIFVQSNNECSGLTCWHLLLAACAPDWSISFENVKKNPLKRDTAWEHMSNPSSRSTSWYFLADNASSCWMFGL